MSKIFCKWLDYQESKCYYSNGEYFTLGSCSDLVVMMHETLLKHALSKGKTKWEEGKLVGHNRLLMLVVVNLLWIFATDTEVNKSMTLKVYRFVARIET